MARARRYATWPSFTPNNMQWGSRKSIPRAFSPRFVKHFRLRFFALFPLNLKDFLSFHSTSGAHLSRSIQFIIWRVLSEGRESGSIERPYCTTDDFSCRKSAKMRLLVRCPFISQLSVIHTYTVIRNHHSRFPVYLSEVGTRLTRVYYTYLYIYETHVGTRVMSRVAYLCG